LVILNFIIFFFNSSTLVLCKKATGERNKKNDLRCVFGILEDNDVFYEFILKSLKITTN
jgi:hypothetical protein